jgi:hypothetical protein
LGSVACGLARRWGMERSRVMVMRARGCCWLQERSVHFEGNHLSRYLHLSPPSPFRKGPTFAKREHTGALQEKREKQKDVCGGLGLDRFTLQLEAIAHFLDLILRQKLASVAPLYARIDVEHVDASPQAAAQPPHPPLQSTGPPTLNLFGFLTKIRSRSASQHPSRKRPPRVQPLSRSATREEKCHCQNPLRTVVQPPDASGLGGWEFGPPQEGGRELEGEGGGVCVEGISGFGWQVEQGETEGGGGRRASRLEFVSNNATLTE